MSWRTLVSRSGVPRWPRKYLEATTLVASCVQVLGTSISCCSKTTSPSPPVMTAERLSHSTVFQTSSPGSVKRRAIFRPGNVGAVREGGGGLGDAGRVSTTTGSETTDFSTSALYLRGSCIAPYSLSPISKFTKRTQCSEQTQT